VHTTRRIKRAKSKRILEELNHARRSVVPCYIDVFYPGVGITALELLEKLDVEVEYPSKLLQHLPQMQPFLRV
jgi:Fe-S oxidoreductase